MRLTACRSYSRVPSTGRVIRWPGLFLFQETDLLVQGGLEELGVIRLHVLKFAPRGTDGEDEVQSLHAHQAAQVIDQRAAKGFLDLAVLQVVEFVEGEQQCPAVQGRKEVRQEAVLEIFEVFGKIILFRCRTFTCRVPV
jgi:hypothetical protein